MTISISNVLANAAYGTSTAEFASVIGKYYLLSVVWTSTTNTTPTFTASNGITFSVLRSRSFSYSFSGTTNYLYQAVLGGTCAAGSTGTISVNTGSATMTLDAASGVSLATPVVQSNGSAGTATVPGGSSVSTSLAAFGSSVNATYVTGFIGNANATPESGYTQLSDNESQILTAWNASNDTTPSWVQSGLFDLTFVPSSNTFASVMALELADASVVTLGPQDGSTATSSGGSVPWTLPANALTSNNAYASHLTNLTAGNNPNLDIKGFDFSAIPHDATILGLTAGFEHKYAVGSTGNVRVNIAQFLKAGVAVGTNLAATGTNIPSSDTYVTVGGASSLNGAPWTAADLKAPDFGFRLRYIANGTGANRNINVDHVRISVTYTGGSPGVLATLSVTDEDDTLVSTATVVPPSSGTSDVIALLHMNEGSFDARPTTLVNSAPGSLTFSNIGSDGSVGGQFWFDGEGPFGQGVHMQADNNATCAVLSDQTINVTKGMTHEFFMTETSFDNGRAAWSLGFDGGPFLRLMSYDYGDGTFSLELEGLVPGYAYTTIAETGPFTPTPGTNGIWIVTQWRDDGYFEIWVNGTRLCVSTVAYDATFTDVKLAIFGSYDPVSQYAGGWFQKVVGEFRFSKKQQYTGSSLAVPTSRFPDPEPSTGPTPVTATLIVADENDAMSASAEAVVTATASWTDQDDGLAASASTLVSAALVLIDADDTFAATVTSGAVPIEATFVVTDEADTFAAAATVLVSASTALVDSNDTMSATASVVVNAVTNLVDAEDTFASTTTTANTITFNVTDDNDTFAATAAVIVTANAVLIDADDTFSAAVSIPTAVKPHRGGGLYPSQVRSKRDSKRLEAFKRDQEDRRKAVEEAVYGKPPEEIEQAIAVEVQALESLLTPEFLARYAEAQELAHMFIAQLQRLEAELIEQQRARIEAEYREMEDVMLALARTRMGRNRFSLILRRQ